MKFIDWFADESVYVVDLALACCGVEGGSADCGPHLSGRPLGGAGRRGGVGNHFDGVGAGGVLDH